MGNAESYTYTYDSFGNRLGLTYTGEVGYQIGYAYDKNNRLLREQKVEGNSTETTNFTYDNNGNLLLSRKETFSPADGQPVMSVDLNNDTYLEEYTYNGFNQMKTAQRNGKTASYTYNGDGLRMSKTVDGLTTNHTWDGTNLVLDTQGSESTLYLRANGLVASIKGNTTQKYVFDAHGDVVQLTNLNGTVTKNYTYDAFGVEKDADEEDTNPFRYCGEYYDGETGSIYLRARYYSPTRGRFTTEDPIRSGFNWYGHCNGNPVNYWDPYGLDPVDTNTGGNYVMIKYAVQDAFGEDYVYTEFDEVSKTVVVKAKINDARLAVLAEGQYYIINGRAVTDIDTLKDALGGGDAIRPHYPGQTFDSEEDAALAFGLRFNEASINSGVEYGATIIKRDDKYIFDYVTTDNDRQKVNMDISDRASVAVVHTHPAGQATHSSGDIKNAINYGKNSYVIAGQWFFAKFDAQQYRADGNGTDLNNIHIPKALEYVTVFVQGGPIGTLAPKK